jgi:SOS regulatory protein LexA
MLTKTLVNSIMRKVLEIKGDKSYETFAQEIKAKTGKNIHYTSLQKIATGERVPSLEMLSILAEYGGIDFKEFFESVDLSSKTKSVVEYKKSIDDKKVIAEIDNKLFRIPLIGFVPAGGPVITEENLEDYIELPLDMVKGGHDFCLKVRGDSMIDMGIDDGDTILVHPQPIAENGQTVIARINGAVTCKRFYRTNGKCSLEPANNKYKPINCEDIEIVGIVTKIIKDVF